MLPDTAVRGDSTGAAPRRNPITWCADLSRARRSGPELTHTDWRQHGPSTIAVHAGSIDDPTTGAVGTPIYQTTTFLLDADQYQSIDDGFSRDRFIYTRYGNPNQWAVQEKVAALEGAESALVFSSGMAAISATVLALVDKGAHVLTSRDLYGGTYAFFHQELPTLGMRASFVDPRDLEAVAQAIRPETQLLFFEAMSNPLLKMADIPALAALASRRGVRLVIDATFVTPLGMRPLEHGVDVVIHSASKYLNGHSDLIAGTAAGSRKLLDRVWGRLQSWGGCLDPHGCFLLERGLKTLALRMHAHHQGALAVARYLSTHPAIAAVYHPLLQTHPDHAVAERLLGCGSGMVTFDVKGGDEAALALCKALRLPKQATSLGGVESLVSLPFNTSHAAMTSAQRSALGIQPGCVRFSVGIEDPNDLIADLSQALHTIIH